MVAEFVCDVGSAQHHGTCAIAAHLHLCGADIVADFGVISRVEIFLSRLHAHLARQVLVAVLCQAQRVAGGGNTSVNRHSGQYLVHILVAQAVFLHIAIQPTLHAEGGGRMLQKSIVTGDGGAEYLMENSVSTIAALGQHLGGTGNGVGHFHAARQHHIVHAGGDEVGSGFQCHITGAASLALVERTLALHAEPVGNVHVGGGKVTGPTGTGLSVNEEVHIGGGNAGISHGLDGGIAEQLALSNAVELGIILGSHKRRCAYADDGHTAFKRLEGRIVLFVSRFDHFSSSSSTVY